MILGLVRVISLFHLSGALGKFYIFYDFIVSFINVLI